MSNDNLTKLIKTIEYPNKIIEYRQVKARPSL